MLWLYLRERCHKRGEKKEKIREEFNANKKRGGESTAYLTSYQAVFIDTVCHMCHCTG
jgi:hypothetical protein